MQFDTLQSHLHVGHVLHDQRIDAGIDHLPGDALRLGQFVVKDQRIERHVDPHAERPGRSHHTGDVLHRVAGRLPRTETGSAHIHGIGPAGNGSPGHLRVACRSQQFDGMLSRLVLHVNAESLCTIRYAQRYARKRESAPSPPGERTDKKSGTAPRGSSADKIPERGTISREPVW